MSYTARDFEDALGILWNLVENRLTTEEESELLIAGSSTSKAASIFSELQMFGPSGPVGIGLGKCGGHAVGD